MSIIKYGTAYVYGYGLWTEMSYRKGFHTNIGIVAKSETTIDTKETLSGFDGYIHGISEGGNKIPLHLVMDDSEMIWREYFSGMTIDTLRADPVHLSYDFDIDRIDKDDVIYSNITATDRS